MEFVRLLFLAYLTALSVTQSCAKLLDDRKHLNGKNVEDFDVRVAVHRI